MHKSSTISLRSYQTIGVLCALMLTGCALTPREIGTNVETFANMQSVTLPTTYRWEQLPSQAAQPQFTPIQQAAEKSLARVGLTLSAKPALAPLIAQLSATASQGRSQHPAYDNFYGPRFSLGVGFGHGGWGAGIGGISWLDTPPVIYYRGIKLVLRHAQTQQIVYETTAEYDDVRPYDPLIWTVLFDAALRDFPTPPDGKRQLFIPIPPTSSSANETHSLQPTTPKIAQPNS